MAAESDCGERVRHSRKGKFENAEPCRGNRGDRHGPVEDMVRRFRQRDSDDMFSRPNDCAYGALRACQIVRIIDKNHHPVFGKVDTYGDFRREEEKEPYLFQFRTRKLSCFRCKTASGHGSGGLKAPPGREIRSGNLT